MNRKLLLISIVAILCVAAIGLRVRSQRVRTKINLNAPATTQPATSHPAFAITVPRDYVVAPLVDPTELTAGPQRIVSLAPSVTETVCALGMRDRLVGRTEYCQWPADLDKVPAVGTYRECNYGMVQSLDPDLVLTPSNSGETVANLQRLGLPCQSVPHEGIDQVYAAIEHIGRVCDRPKTAAALVAAIQADTERMKTAVKNLHARPKRAIVLFGDLPVPPGVVFVAGPGLFLDDLVEMAGHQNAAREVLKSSQGEIPLERMRVLDPEIILEFRDRPQTPEAATEMYQAWAEVGDLQAIRNHRVRTLGALEWLSAGPRIAIELHRFIAVLSEPE